MTSEAGMYQNSKSLPSITRGLGTTSDDITIPKLAEYYYCQLVENKEALDRIRAFLSIRRVEMNKFNRA